MTTKKHILNLSIILAVVPCGFQQAWANTNPENTLPVIQAPPLATKPSVTIEAAQETDSRIQQILSTKVMVNKFDIQGVDSIPLSNIEEMLKPHEGRQVSIRELVDLAKSITALYKKKGYPLSYAFVPPQPFDKQTVTIQVIEGYIGKLKLEGDFGNSEEKIRSIVQPMLQERPLTQATLSRNSGLLKLVPGLSLQAFLSMPQTRDGSAELSIKSQRNAIISTGRLESLSPKFRGLVSIQANSHSPSAEQTTFTTLLSNDNEEYYAASYSQMLGSKGLIFKIDGSVYDGVSGEDSQPGLKRDVLSLRLSTSLSYPLIADRNQTLIASVGLTAVNFDDEIKNEDTLRGITSKTNSRALTLGANYTNTTATQYRVLQLNLSKGLNTLGASKSIKPNFLTTLNSTNPADLDFEKINLGYLQSNIWPRNFATVISMTGQYSPDNLPITERIQFGGFQYGRAFRPGVLFGDSGWGLSAELSKLFSVSHDFSYFQLLGIQPYGLAEAAKTYQNIEISNDNEIRSLALGVRLRTDVAGVMDIAIAKSVTGRDGQSEDDLTFSFNFGFLLN